MRHHVAQLVNEWGEDLVGDVGLSSVCAVVGATHPRAVAEARRLMPRTIMLLPGVGAQRGASVAELSQGVHERAGERACQCLSVGDLRLRMGDTDSASAAGAEAARLKREVWAASGW